MPDDDFFKNAGKELRDELVVDNANRDQALAAVDAFTQTATKGIDDFYDGKRHGVRVVNYDEYASIYFEIRCDKNGNHINGPSFFLIANANGTLSHASSSDWRPRGDKSPVLNAQQVDLAEYDQQTADLLVSFLKESERKYRGHIAG